VRRVSAPSKHNQATPFLGLLIKRVIFSFTRDFYFGLKPSTTSEKAVNNYLRGPVNGPLPANTLPASVLFVGLYHATAVKQTHPTISCKYRIRATTRRTLYASAAIIDPSRWLVHAGLDSVFFQVQSHLRKSCMLVISEHFFYCKIYLFSLPPLCSYRFPRSPCRLECV
jgi:hypothetical protein